MSYFELYEKRKQLKPGSVWSDVYYPELQYVIVEVYENEYTNNTMVKYRTLKSHREYKCPMLMFLNATIKVRDSV